MQVQKGIIQSTDGTTATVVPNQHPEIVTQPLVVPFYWGATMGNIQPGDEVYFFEDSEHGGYIIGRTDGRWDNTLTGEFTIKGGMTASGDIKASGISLKNHTHTGDSGGNTSAPQ